MPEHPTCDLCSVPIEPHEHFIVRIDAFADPSVPAVDTNTAAAGEVSVEALLKQMQLMSADELQDGVHRRFEYKLCAACHKQFLANPLGAPRRRRAGNN